MHTHSTLRIPFTSIGISSATAVCRIFSAVYNAACGLEFQGLTALILLQQLLRATSLKVVIVVVLWTLNGFGFHSGDDAGRITHNNLECHCHGSSTHDHFPIALHAAIGANEIIGKHFIVGAGVDQERVVGRLVLAICTNFLGQRNMTCRLRQSQGPGSQNGASSGVAEAVGTDSVGVTAGAAVSVGLTVGVGGTSVH